MKHIISLGAGVQSSTMALMFAKGELTPMPDCAIFADTGDEPKEVYVWLNWLEKLLPFPVYRVKPEGKGALSEESTKLKLSKRSGRTYLAPSVPVFVTNQKGGKGMMRRQCTRTFKIDPINKKIKEFAEVKRGEKETQAISYIGISLDESLRMKPSRVKFVENQWPLVDKRITREDCLRWMRENGYPIPPRSACVYCPYHSDLEWTRLKREEPDSFAAAVTYEKKLQAAYAESTALSGVPFMHHSRVPLEDAKLNPQAQQIDMFNNDCEGMCGV